MLPGRHLCQLPAHQPIPSFSILLCAQVTDLFRVHHLCLGWVQPVGDMERMGKQERRKIRVFLPYFLWLGSLVLAVAVSLSDSSSTPRGSALTHLWSHSFHSLIF